MHFCFLFEDAVSYLLVCGEGEVEGKLQARLEREKGTLNINDRVV